MDQNAVATSEDGVNLRERRVGRPLGRKDKISQDIRVLARQYGAGAIAELWRLAIKAKSEAVRVLAIKELLDRGYGKAVQAHEITGANGGPIEVYHAIEEGALTADERAVLRGLAAARSSQPIIDVESSGSPGLPEQTD